jgi:hypothetical protein
MKKSSTPINKLCRQQHKQEAKKEEKKHIIVANFAIARFPSTKRPPTLFSSGIQS